MITKESNPIMDTRINYVLEKIERKNYEAIMGYFNTLSETTVQDLVGIITGNSQYATSREYCYNNLIAHFMDRKGVIE